MGALDLDLGLPAATPQRIKFFCAGLPAPKGSTKAFFIKKLNRAVVTSDNTKTKPWQNALLVEAMNARTWSAPSSAPMFVRIVFRFPRPKGHYRSNGEVRPTAPARHVQKPDIDKLERAALDAFTGVLFVDDSQVCETVCTKRYCESSEEPGAEVEAEILEAA